MQLGFESGFSVVGLYPQVCLAAKWLLQRHEIRILFCDAMSERHRWLIFPFSCYEWIMTWGVNENNGSYDQVTAVFEWRNDRISVETTSCSHIWNFTSHHSRDPILILADLLVLGVFEWIDSGLPTRRTAGRAPLRTFVDDTKKVLCPKICLNGTLSLAQWQWLH